MDFSMFEDLPDVQNFLNGKNVRDSVSDLMNSLGGSGSNNGSSGKMSMSADNDKDKSKTPGGRFPQNTPIAMAYVPKQQWDKTYTSENGMKKGTMFPELDLPFAPEEGCYDTER